MLTLKRRELLVAAAALVGGCECGKRRSDDAVDAATLVGRWRELDFLPSAPLLEPERMALLVEREAPLLVALHGAGETARGLVAGARGWRDDYELDRALGRVQQPPLTSEDLLGFVQAERLARLNASLAAQPWRGLAVACPYTPRPRERSIAGAKPFAGFVVEKLLPRARQEVGGEATRARTGIDGVSMGGRLALLIGWQHPEVFGAVGALQPAIGVEEVLELSQLARAARDKSPQKIRLVSSDGDPFLDAVKRLAQQLQTDGVEHELLVTPGPHDYVWNRGPGSYEMLLWHERVLHGTASP